MRFTSLFLVLLSLTFGDIPQKKLALIQKAMDIMHIKSKMDGFIRNVAAVKAKRIQNDNLGMSDSLAGEIQTAISGVYQENLEGDNGLYPQLYQIVDKYLTDDDLKFVMHYNQSDGGQRYAKLAPRIVGEAVEVERKWSENLEPVIVERLNDRFQGLNFSSM